MVVKNREKRVTGDGRREIDVRAIGALWGDESVGVEAVFPVFAVFLLHVQSYEKNLKLPNRK